MSQSERFLVILVLWALFPVIAFWIWVTNPGVCGLIWKKEIEESWFKTKDNQEE